MVIYERLGTCPKYRTRRANLTFFLVVALAPPRTSAWAPPNLLSINMVLPPSIRSPELNRFQRSSSRGNRRSRDTTCWAVNSCITWVMRPPSIHDRATEERHRNQRSRSIPALSMKVKSRKGGRGSRGGSTATASRSPKGRKSLLIEVQDMASDAWKWALSRGYVTMFSNQVLDNDAQRILTHVRLLTSVTRLTFNFWLKICHNTNCLKYVLKFDGRSSPKIIYTLYNYIS